MKRILSIILASLMIVGLCACDKKEDDGTITLTMWTIATESDSHHQPYLDSIKEYEEAHPGVKIQMETFENESYKTKIVSAVAANELPDIFFTWGGGFSTSFVESGRVLCVDEYYENYKDELPEAMLGNLTWDGKKYGCSYTMNVSMLFYNKAMFEQYGLTAPTTFDELVACCQTFIDNGITPFGISAKDTWVLAQAHDAFTLKSVGADLLTNVLTKTGEGSYNSEGFIAASTAFMDLVSMGAYGDDAAGLSNDEACQFFYHEEVPMYIMGSWMPGSIMTDAETPDNFGVVPVPVLNSDNASLSDFMGGPSDSLMVAASTKHPEEAAEAMFEISRGVSHYGYLNGCGIPAWKVTYDDSSVNALTREVAAYVADASSLTLWFDTLMEAEDKSVYLENLQLMYLGDISPEEFCELMSGQLGY